MSVFDDMRALIDQMEQENGPMSEIVEAMKTQGGHLTNFGDEFVMLCRKWDIQQATVARAIDISATSVNRRYNRQIVKGSFWHRKKKHEGAERRCLTAITGMGMTCERAPGGLHGLPGADSFCEQLSRKSAASFAPCSPCR